jgi:bacterioferritin (cytochrome b1)
VQGTKATVSALEQAVQLEAQLRAQYGIDVKDLNHDGVCGLASKVKSWKSDVGMWFKRASQETLLVQGDPTYTISDLKQHGSVADVLGDALTAETAAYDFYTKQAPILRDAGDEAQGHVFQHFCKWHRAHIGEIEKEQRVLKQLGETAYLAVNSKN